MSTKILPTRISLFERQQLLKAVPFVTDLKYRVILMKREDVIRILHEHHHELADRYGVKSLALFGSVARDEATERSDVDLLVEFDRPVGLFGLFELQDYLETLLRCSVDVGTRASLKPRLRPHVFAECIDVA